MNVNVNVNVLFMYRLERPGRRGDHGGGRGVPGHRRAVGLVLPIGAQPGAKTQKTVPAQNLSNDEARAPRPLGHARLHTRRS